MQSISPQLLVRLIKLLLPAYEWLINDVRKNQGYFNFPPKTVAFLSRGHATPWAAFYQNFNQVKNLVLFTLVGQDQIPDIVDFLNNSTAQEKVEFAEELGASILEEFSGGYDIDDSEMMTEREARLWWASATEKERKDAITSSTLWLYSIVTMVCHYFGILTFGKSLCDLIADAIDGEDEAFCKAVQIDKTVLYSIPYFRERLARAQLTNDFAFLKRLSTAIVGRPLAGYIKHKELMFIFAILDDEGLLGMPLEELFDLCEDLDIYGSRFGIHDVGSLAKRRQYYLEKTGRKLQYLRPSPTNI